MPDTPEQQLKPRDGRVVKQTVHFGYCEHCDWYCTNEFFPTSQEELWEHLETSHGIEGHRVELV